MKFLFAVIGGFTLTIGIFVGGVAFALSFLSADPVPVQRTSVEAEPEFLADIRKIDVTAQDYERVEPTTPHPAFDDETVDRAGVEDIVTSALPDDPPRALSAEHVAWCSRRYRSYDEQTNSYRPYSGGNRECISPYSEQTPADEAPHNVEHAELAAPFDQAALGTESLDLSHIEYCSARYRSYRVEDNTYQPYNGPRRQCVSSAR